MIQALNPRAKTVVAESDYLLCFTFRNGEQKRFDMKPYLHYPVFKKLENTSYFIKARVENDTIVWDEKTDFSPDSLYLDGVLVK